MILETLCLGPLETNCYILAASTASAAIIIDPGSDVRAIRQVLKKHKLTPAFIINTHGHYDHIACDDKFGVPVYVHRLDEALLKDSRLNLSAVFGLGFSVKSQIRVLEDGDKVKLDPIKLEVRHIPGHTPGGIALLMEEPVSRIVFTGDSLFCQSIGRTDLAGGNQKALVEAIKSKLLVLPDDTVVYPGHGSSSTIGAEKRSNPFLG
ncbi:MAG: MBL fold metallo-hydrolase [Candidatus Omnitrophica bacterium]|nr:MBL fold metallo-hydrolase [Candidatus Omnitrophota bacterium]